MELLIGCGHKRDKRIFLDGQPEWNNLVTLDMNPDVKPDVVWDLEKLPLPFNDNSFDGIYAFEVLEHVGRQGDWRFFLDQFADFWRILKPNGFMCGTSPSLTSRWLWGDPGHTRIICPESFVFLSQFQYTKQIGQTAMTDYRFHYKADFERQLIKEEGDSFAFALKAIKPARIG